MGVNLIFLTVPLTELLPTGTSRISDLVCRLIVYISYAALAVFLLRKKCRLSSVTRPLGEQAEESYIKADCL